MICANCKKHYSETPVPQDIAPHFCGCAKELIRCILCFLPPKGPGVISGYCICDECDKPTPSTVADMPLLTPREELFALHNKLTLQAFELMKRKNADYAGSTDPFANFRLCESARICSAQQGILMRMLDKVSRLSTHASGQKLNTDSMMDSVVDIINYAVLYAAMEKEQK